MQLLEQLSKASFTDQEKVSQVFRAVLATPDGNEMFNALDQLVTLHIDPAGSEDRALRETNAQRSLLAEIKIIASDTWLTNQRSQHQKQASRLRLKSK